MSELGFVESGGAVRPIFFWAKPLRTSISPQTLSSFPFTFFFGITFSATSIVSVPNRQPTTLLVGTKLRPPELAEREELVLESGGAESPFEVPAFEIVDCRLAKLWPGGTCQVALCEGRRLAQMQIGDYVCVIGPTMTFPNVPLPRT